MSLHRKAALAFGSAIALGLALPAAPALATTTISYSSATGVLVQGDANGEGLSMASVNDDRDFVAVPATYGSSPGGIPAGNLVAGSGCTSSSGDIRCVMTGSRVVTASLGDGADGIGSHDTTFPLDLFLNGEGGNDRLSGADGFDSISGGPGADVLDGRRGNDLVQGGDGDDLIEQFSLADPGGTDTIRGDAGNDTFKASNRAVVSPDLFDGGAGTDVADYSSRDGAVTLKVPVGFNTAPDDGAAGEGDDLDDVETVIGGNGNDTLEFANATLALAPRGAKALRGGPGADSLRAVNRIRTSMDGGLGPDVVRGGPSEDTIFSREGEADTITCGGAIDTLAPDLRDVPVSPDCENLQQSDRREGPNVVFRTKAAVVRKDGRLAIRLSCPRSVGIGCRGTLVARVDRNRTRFGAKQAYSLARGKSATVVVKLPAGQVAAARRRGARVRVRSVERGVHGDKTTQSSLPARGG